MTRKIARQSEVTPLNTIDEYLWNERLGVTQLPQSDMSQGQSPTSTLPPQSSQAPTVDYDSSVAPSDMFGSGVSGQNQLIAPKVPEQERSSAPAVSKAAASSSTYLDNCPECGERIKDDTDTGYECHDGQRWCGTHHPKSCPDHNFFNRTSSADSPLGLADHLMTEHGMLNELIRDHDENVKLHDQEHRDWPNSGGHKHPEHKLVSSMGLNNTDPMGLDTNSDMGLSGGGYKHSYKTAVSTLYGDVDPTPTTGESSNNGSQSNRNNSPDEEPGGPGNGPSKAPAAAGEEEGGAGLASGLGEAAELAVLAKKRWIGSVLDPKEAKFKYIRHNSKTGKWEIFSKKTGKTLSTHDSEKQAEKAFSAMEANMHG
jgi:hypothetical protein